MDALKQQALDYTLGILPKDESLLFEALLEEDEEVQRLLTEAQDDFAKLSLTAPPSTLGAEVRKRIMDHCHPPLDLDPFLDSLEIDRLRENFSVSDNRYSGGGGSVDLSDLNKIPVKDGIVKSYESLLEIMPMVAGDSKAASGDFSDLQLKLRSNEPFSHQINSTLNSDWDYQDPSCKSVLRSALASMPSLSFFSDRLREDQPSIGDVRRLFYLCRDQLKIMRASFRDLDKEKLLEDEKLRYHGAGLLRTKWWGAEHAYFSSKGKVRCGHFFDGPITERCVEFAEYDANMYCLANLLAPRSADGEFHLELLKDTVPGCTLAVSSSKMSDNHHQSLSAVIDQSTKGTDTLKQDSLLWELIEDSMIRGHQNSSINELREKMAFGQKRIKDTTYLWFAWPAIQNIQEGADA